MNLYEIDSMITCDNRTKSVCPVCGLAKLCEYRPFIQKDGSRGFGYVCSSCCTGAEVVTLLHEEFYLNFPRFFGETGIERHFREQEIS
jgi:hypothetical protein